MKFENNNKKIIKKITNRSIKANKTRNIFVIIAIVLTTFMLASVFTLGISFSKNYSLMTLREMGMTTNALLENPTKEQKSIIQNLNLCESIGEQISVGFVESDTFKKNDQNILIQCLDNEAWQKQITPAIGDIKGSYPQKENEIMLSQSAINLLKLKNVKIGDIVKLDCNIDGKVESKEFVINGTYTDYSMVNKTGVDKIVYISKAFADKYNLSTLKNGVLTMDIKDSKKDKAPDILKSKVDLNKGQNFNYGFETDTNEAQEVMVAAIAIVVIIGLFMVLSGYLLIYNILYIAITKDIQFYGMLKTIGTSPKQIKKIVKGQGLRLSLIGIPIGIILAVVVSFLIVPSAIQGFCTGTYYEDMMPTQAYFTPFVFIGTILFSLFTVWVSSIKPAKIASRISPTEALNYTGIKFKKQKRNRKSTNGGKIYKMAWYNVFRDKKRAILVFLSLFMGIITFLSVNTFISSLSLENYLNEYYPNDFEILDMVEKNSAEIDKQVHKIKDIQGVKDVSTTKFSCLELRWNKNVLMPSLKNSYDRYADSETSDDELKEYIKQIKKEPSKLKTMVAFLNDKTIEEINKNSDEKIDLDAFKEGKLALLDTFFYGDTKNIDISNEKIVLKTPKRNNSATLNVDFMISSDTHITFTEDNEIGIPHIYVSQSLVDNFSSDKMTDWVQIDVQKEKSKVIQHELKSIIENKHMYLESKLDASENFTQSKIMMNVVGGGISLIFIFIGLLNFINVIVTNVNTRLRELAIMESVGMTKKQIKKMLTFEGLYYAEVTLVMIFTIGIAIVYGIAKLTQNLADYATFVFPGGQLIFLIVVITAVCTITPKIVYKYSSKDSVIERLREIDK